MTKKVRIEDACQSILKVEGERKLRSYKWMMIHQLQISLPNLFTFSFFLISSFSSSLSSHSLQHSVHCFKIKRRRVACQYILPRLVSISLLHFHSFNCDLMKEKKGESKVVTQMSSSSSHQKFPPLYSSSIWCSRNVIEMLPMYKCIPGSMSRRRLEELFLKSSI